MYIIIDSNGICHREAHAIGNLSFDERKTGVIFGFLREVLKLSKLYSTSNFIFCWDSRTSLRKKIYPEYKSKRKELEPLDDSVYTQFELLKTKVLPSIGFKNIFYAEGYESDDLIAQIVYDYPDMHFILASSDSDLYQLLFSNVSIYNLHSKKEFTQKDFEKKYGLSFDSWADVKSIAGCTSDNIKGIVGVGEKTAIEYLKGNLKSSSKVFERITSEEGMYIKNRNWKLVCLPFKGTPNVDLVDEEVLSLLGFMTVCKKYGFASLLKDIDIHIKRLNLQ